MTEEVRFLGLFLFAMSHSITLAMITKNEERCLGRCLASVRNFVDEIVIVDTGSTDATHEIANSYGAILKTILWPGAFDEARNQSLDLVKTEWVFWLDADEWLMEESAQCLLALSWNDFEAVTVERREWNEGTSMGQTELIRLWRHRPERKFVGVVHEWIPDFDLQMEKAGQFAKSQAIIEHDGYGGDLKIEKLERNLELIQQELSLRPNQLKYEIYLAETFADLNRQEASPLFLNISNKIGYCEEDLSREPKVMSFINHQLHSMTVKDANSELAERLLFRVATWFPNSPPLRWAAAKVEAQRGNFRNCLDHLLAIEQMAVSKNYIRWQAFDEGILGKLLYDKMLQVAEFNHRQDIVDRCKQWIQSNTN